MTNVLGTVAEVAKAWNLDERLECVSRIGRAYGECLRSAVEVTRRARTLAGIAYTDERRIVLNAQLLVPGREEHRDSTFLHECAHMVANVRYGCNCRHDWRWRRIMDMLGEPPEVSHTLDFLSRELHAVVTWICTACGEDYHFVRRPRRRIQDCYCRACGPDRGRLVVAANLRTR